MVQPAMNYNFMTQQPDYGNILAQSEQVKASQQNRQMNALKMRDYESARAAAGEAAEFEKNLKIFKTAHDTGTQEGVDQVYAQMLPGVTPPKMTFKGNKIKYEFESGIVLEGDPVSVRRVTNLIIRDPALLTDPEKKKQLPRILADAEVSLTRGKQSEDKIPTTAMGAYLKNNPNATPDEVALYSQKLKGKGMQLTVGPDGTVQFSEGGGDMQVKTKGNIEEKIINANEQYTRMSGILSTFKPEYQQTATKLGVAWDQLSEKMGATLKPEDTKTLVEFNTHKRRSIENINLYIKEITGAQMSEKEATRLRSGMPDPGDSWYNGDSPTQFKAKAEDILKYSRAAQARWTYYLNKGFTPQEITKMINNDEAVDLETLRQRMQ